MVFLATARLNEWHHFYFGLGLAAWAMLTRRRWLLGIAVVIVSDDAWQHLKQMAGYGDYTSPLHRLFAAYLWPHPVVQWLVARLDALFA